MTKTPRSVFSDLRGFSQLTVDAVAGVTDLVEDMHRNIAGVAPIVGKAPTGRTTGITGLVYRSVRGVTRAVGLGLDVALGQLAPLLRRSESSARREAVLAALNGVLGDYLLATHNPLAIPMQLRQQGQALVLERAALATNPALQGDRLLVLVHGLCMNDLQWTREGHDHGAALAQDLDYTPLYLHYNTGLHIAANGRELAGLLEQLVQAWPVPVRELVIVGHSMGGLVARSACHCAAQSGHGWLQCLKALVFLGTPNLGAPLERAGSRADMLLGISPYTAPFVRLGKIRSQGIQDLRHGHLQDEAAAAPVPLPEGVPCFAIAASQQAKPGANLQRLRGDGLVPVRSALGQHKDPALALPIPPSHQAICYGIGHFDLLSSREVYDHLRRWLTAG